MSTLDNVVVTGKSGAGKQPRIDVLLQEFGLRQLSTGTIFRHYLGLLKGLSAPQDAGALAPESYWDEASGWFVTDERIAARVAPTLRGPDAPGVDDVVLALKVSRFVLAGLFVPDRITNELLAAAFGKHGYHGCVLDGYPRTPQQAEFFADLLARHDARLDLVLLVEAEDADIIARLSGRRICPDGACGKVYHLQHKPPRDGRTCDACGREVILRADDREDKIRMRLQEFGEKARPALDWLQRRGVRVARVPGNLPRFTEDAVRASVLDALAAVGIGGAA